MLPEGSVNAQITSLEAPVRVDVAWARVEGAFALAEP